MNLINAQRYVEMLESGIRNVGKNKKKLNDLNVFPVPDGDTGTNMYMTLKYGFDNCKKDGNNLSKIASGFASLAVFGARGNSGVILSQFFKGIAEGFSGCVEGDVEDFYQSLEYGCQQAYLAVAKPVEGTMLTVIREATEKVRESMPLLDVKELVKVFTTQAKLTLIKTPDMLPVLKKARVVDSGGAGIVCFFEGVLSYLNGEEPEEVFIDEEEEKEHMQIAFDFSIINKDTAFNYGYCVEGLIQLKIDEDDFNIEEFRTGITKLGRSVVATLEKDKVKVHVHTPKLGRVMNFCQEIGEFLTLKIENMSVQNIMAKQEQVKKFLVSEELGENFNVVAVATNTHMQQMFLDMGADVVILTDITPSAQDFVDAFNYLEKEIIVFPNSANSILTATQAAGLSPEKNVKIVNSRSIADCYSALSVLDFDCLTKSAITQISASINAIYKAHIYQAHKEISYSGTKIANKDFFALESSDKVLCVEETLEKATLQTIRKVVKKHRASVVTLFYAKGIAVQFIEDLIAKIDGLGLGIEIAPLCSMETSYSILLAFE